MIPKLRLETGLLTVAVALSRFAFRGHYLYDVDSVNFALAIGRFDPRVHQPHPPGYFLYICLGRLLNLACHDANLALVLLSVLASCGVAIVVYQMAWEWNGPVAARFAGAILLFSPLAWFHGTVALTYSVESFFSAILGYLCWRIAGGGERLVWLAAVTLGISSGIRPSSLLFLAPLFFFSLGKTNRRTVMVAVAILVATISCWALPMLWASGGLHAYLGALVSLWRLVPGRGTFWNSSPATSIARAITIVFIYFLCFGSAGVAPLALMRSTTPVDRRRLIFTAVWITPALCFFTFVFLKFVNSGYLLLLLAPGCIWLGFCASVWWQAGRWSASSKLFIVGLGAAINTLVYLASPLYCSYRSVRHFEARLASTCQALPRIAPAKDTLIVGFDAHFLGYRHAGYYLPDYQTVEYPEVKLIDGTRIFAMRGRDTQLLTVPLAATYPRFVLFPLGDDTEAKEYLQTIMKKVPRQDLTIQSVQGNDFLTGPISDLPLLFPPAPTTPR